MSRPLRVLHVITDLRVGGAETMLVRLLAAMDKERFPAAVAVMVPGGALADPLRAGGWSVSELGLRPGRPDPRGLLRLRRVAREFSPDLVQAWMYHANLAATLATWGMGTPLVWNVRSGLHDVAAASPLTRAVIGLGARLSTRPGTIIYNSVAGRDAHTAAGYDGNRARVLPNGFDTETFRPDPDAAGSLRRELGLPPETPLVGLVGRSHRVKGWDVFLEAVAVLRRRHPRVHAIGVGRGVTAENPETTGRLARPDLAGHVHMLGPRTDVARIMAGLDVLCSASRSEGFPNVLGEALACGTPCVATDVGDSAQLLGEVGLIVPAEAPVALAGAVADILSMGPEARRDLARRGRERVQTHYSLASVARAYGELYGEVTGSA